MPHRLGLFLCFIELILSFRDSRLSALSRSGGMRNLRASEIGINVSVLLVVCGFILF